MKCPKCGSRKVSRILYGMPAWSEKLEEDIKNKKIKIGGCCITDHDPKYYCRSCRRNICYPARYLGVVSIRFSKGGFEYPPEEVLLERKHGGIATASVLYGHKVVHTREMTSDEWCDVLQKLYRKLYLAEWKRKYDNPEVHDGEQWKLEIGWEDGGKQKYWGSNAYPPYWKELNRLLEPYFGEGYFIW